MAGNSTLDLLIAEMLGDVGLLHDEIKSLKETVPALANEIEAACDRAVSKLNQQTGQLIAAGDRHQQLLQSLTDESKKHLLAALQAAKSEQVESMKAMMTEAATQAITAAVTEKMSAAIDGVMTANASRKKSIEEVNKTANAVAKISGRMLSQTIISSIITGVVILLGIYGFYKLGAL